MKILRIIFTILAALCLAAFPLVGIFWGMDYVGIPIFAGGVFFLMMLLCKNKQELQESKQNAAPQGDFLRPLPRTDSNPEARFEQPPADEDNSTEANADESTPTENE